MCDIKGIVLLACALLHLDAWPLNHPRNHQQDTAIPDLISSLSARA